MLSEQLKIISLLHDKLNQIRNDVHKQQNTLHMPVVTEVSPEHLKSINYNFIGVDSRVFNLSVASESLEIIEAMLVINQQGKISFYDQPIANDVSEVNPWNKEKSIRMCKILGLPEELLKREPRQFSIKKLNQFYHDANEPDAKS